MVPLALSGGDWSWILHRCVQCMAYGHNAIELSSLPMLTCVQLFAINLVTVMLGMIYWHESNKGVMTDNASTAIKVATSAGTVAGQLVFGYLADVLGRKRMYGIELLIIISATLAESLSAPSYAVSLVGVLVFWRILLGIGVGGDYPLSAVITAEMADTKWRGAMVSFVFAMQGFGQFAAAMVAFIVIRAYKGTLEPVPDVASCTGNCQVDTDVMWRVVLGFGGIPGWFALYYRLTIPETPRYTFDVRHDLEKAAADSRQFRSGRIGEGVTDPVRQAKISVDMKKYKKNAPSLREFFRYFRVWKHLAQLVGTSGSWFFLDIGTTPLEFSSFVMNDQAYSDSLLRPESEY